MGLASQNSTLASRLRWQVPQSRCFSLLLAMSSRVYLLISSTWPWTSAHPPWPSQPTPQPSTPSLSSPPLCQTPGCRSGRDRSTLSPSHPVFSVLHPQGFRKRFASLFRHETFRPLFCRPAPPPLVPACSRPLVANAPRAKNRKFSDFRLKNVIRLIFFSETV